MLQWWGHVNVNGSHGVSHTHSSKMLKPKPRMRIFALKTIKSDWQWKFWNHNNTRGHATAWDQWSVWFFNALTLLVGLQEEHPAHKKTWATYLQRFSRTSGGRNGWGTGWHTFIWKSAVKMEEGGMNRQRSVTSALTLLVRHQWGQPACKKPSPATTKDWVRSFAGPGLTHCQHA